ncbi:hypothetical protein ACH4E8_14065 [Streptomyces sp. NPDC017979]|uniref:hypothetical protein n=1 Tax=Streptomyces sp. NPDC017979 TaxID=3365024 RepID=UPI0037904676
MELNGVRTTSPPGSGEVPPRLAGAVGALPADAEVLRTRPDGTPVVGRRAR